jgi:hypothetical protein
MITLNYALRGLSLTPQESIDRVANLVDGNPIDEYGLLALQTSLESGKLGGEYQIRVKDLKGIVHTIGLDSDGLLDPWPLPDYRYRVIFEGEE